MRQSNATWQCYLALLFARRIRTERSWLIYQTGTTSAGKENEAQNQTLGEVWSAQAHASQERDRKGLGWSRKGQKHVKTNHEKGFGGFMLPKSGPEKIWSRFNAHLHNFLLLRHVGTRNLQHDTGLPGSEHETGRCREELTTWSTRKAGAVTKKCACTC